ncbi:MAG: adenylate/guanylate cyclase domain-containing protein [Anaerolineales bacterium]
MSILIVDDSSTQRLLLMSLLKSERYTDITSVESAVKAYVALGLAPDGHHIDTDIDLVLMDLSMPEIDGIAACRHIKAHPTVQDIPIIMVTANTELDYLQRAFEAGATDYISKPLNKVELLARVRASLKLKQEMDRRKRLNTELGQAKANLDLALRELQIEKDKSERLLLNVFPEPVAQRLKQGQGVADSYPDVTVLFADIVDFTRLASRMAPQDVIRLLNDFFSRFDELAARYGLEKIKTVGDAYMLVGGLHLPRADHAQAVAEMALDMRAMTTSYMRTTGSFMKLRLGIHSGPVVAGVIGTKRIAYDLWGDTVNIASRLEALAQPDNILVSEETYQILREQYLFSAAGKAHIKGIGEKQVYILMGRGR